MENNNQQQNEQANLENNNVEQLGKKAIRDVANIANKKLRSKIKVMVTTYLASVVAIIVKAVVIITIVLLISGIIEWITEKFEAKESPDIFKKALGIEDLDANKIIKEFIKIEKDEDGEGYHFEFKDGFDEKIKEGAEAVGYRFDNLSDPELWKQFLITDFATQLPNLGGSGQVISNSILSSNNNGTGYWWPIGSAETTTKDGKTFASGDPEIPHGTNVIRGGVSKGWSSESHFKTSGEALDIGGNNQIGHYNIISMAEGIVERADDGYSDTGPNQDNGSMGNCVYVRYPGNILVRYMHLSKGTVAVKVGDIVTYGQVLGKMGHSGESYSPHLHIDMWIGAENSSGGQDIAAYFDATNPRPSKVSNVVSSLDGFLFIGDSITVGLEKNGKVDGKKLTFVGSTGSTPKQWLENKAPASGEVTYSALPEDSDSIKGISIMLGTNEVSQYEELKKLIIKIHEKYPNKPIYVQKILDNATYMNEILTYNNEISSFCNEVDYATFIDATVGVEISDDGIHPSKKGYKTLAKNIKEAITSIKNSGVTSTYLSPEDEQTTTDEITSDEEDFINGAPKEFQGTIKLKRITPNKQVGKIEQNAGVSTIELKYVDPETFKGYINSNDSKVLRTFTLSEDFSEIITAKWSYNGELQMESNSGLDYRNLTANYAMPFEYPMMFHVTGKDALFSQRLMYLVLGSSVDMVLVDNVTTIQTKTTTMKTVTTKETEKKPSSTEESISDVSYSYKEDVYTSTELGAVNSWWCKRSSSFNMNSSYSTSFSDGDNSRKENEKQIIVTQQKIEETIGTYNISSTNTEFESNHEPFVTIYNGSRAKGNTQEDWLLEFMGENDRIANMVEVTKYLLYKATDVDYGVTEFTDINFTKGTVGINTGERSGLAGNQGIVYDFLLIKGVPAKSAAALMGSFQQESGFDSMVVQNHSGDTAFNTTYTNNVDSGVISKNDFVYNGPNGGGYGLAQWTSPERKEGLYNLAKANGTSVGDINTQLEWLWQELNTTHTATLNYMMEHGEDSIESLTTEIERKFENAGIPAMQNRINAAKSFYNEYEEKHIVVAGGGESAGAGEGYDKVFTSASGRTYKLFIQNRYRDVYYWGNNVAESGCGPSSAAIILSGFGKSDTPRTVATSYAANGSWAGECKFFTDRGLKAVQGPVDWNKAISHLKSGNPMVVSINSGISINGCYYTGHFLTFLGINETGDQIYIGDPGYNGKGSSWQKISFLQNSGAFGQFFYVSQ